MRHKALSSLSPSSRSKGKEERRLEGFPFEKESFDCSSLPYLLFSNYVSLALSMSGVFCCSHSTYWADAGVAIRKDSLVEIWDGIERFWEDFESLRHGAGGISTLSGGLVREEDVERFVSG